MGFWLLVLMALLLLLPVFTYAAQAASPTASIGGVLLFAYSYFALFYIADWVDNRLPFKWSTVPLMLVSFVASMIVGVISQLVGLARYKNQHTWAKTEHKLHGEKSVGA